MLSRTALETHDERIKSPASSLEFAGAHGPGVKLKTAMLGSVYSS